MTYETIRFDIADDVATITLHRPDSLNAASLQMFDELNHALDNLGTARALLITGAGRAFCSGADLSARAGASTPPGDMVYDALTNSSNPLILKLSHLPIPVVTAVNGAAAGIGCSLALTGDFVFVGTSGYFLQAFVNIGLVPDGGASWLLTRLIGKARATEMMLLGERVHGPKAVEWGLAYKAVEDASLLDEARLLVHRLATGPTRAIGLMRRAMTDALETDYATALQREAENQRTAWDSADAAEGTASFLQKRKPVFRGA
jgi:2-(1,2-epoxy-1,2-dihydrophenyl)acetyl-CoA isomerase